MRNVRFFRGVVILIAALVDGTPLVAPGTSFHSISITAG